MATHGQKHFNLLSFSAASVRAAAETATLLETGAPKTCVNINTQVSAIEGLNPFEQLSSAKCPTLTLKHVKCLNSSK